MLDAPDRGAGAAALRGAGVSARVEGVAAGTRRNRVRVADGEAAAHEGVDVVDLGVFE